MAIGAAIILRLMSASTLAFLLSMQETLLMEQLPLITWSMFRKKNIISYLAEEFKPEICSIVFEAR